MGCDALSIPTLPIALCSLFSATVFFSLGETQSSLQLLYRIRQNTISLILAETVVAIYNVLVEEYLTTPATPEKWQKTIDDFYNKFGFPNCFGALDGNDFPVFSMFVYVLSSFLGSLESSQSP